MPALILILLLCLPHLTHAQTRDSFSVRLVIFTQCQAVPPAQSRPGNRVACSTKDPHTRHEQPLTQEDGVPIARTVITY